jgi:hypothetical protein
MTSGTKMGDPTSGAERVSRLTWFLRIHGGVEVNWNWQLHGTPPVQQLAPVRMPRSSESSRHIPVSAYS